MQYVKMAVGWDPVRRNRFGSRARDIDLDAAALLTFAESDNAFCRLIDGTTDRELTRYDLAAAPVPGLLMGVLRRDSPAWNYRPLELPLAARHPVEAVPAIAAHPA